MKRDFGEPDIVGVVKVQQLRWEWDGHLASMTKNRVPSTLVRNDPAGRRGIGHPKMRWVDGVESHRALGISSWQSITNDRQRWNPDTPSGQSP